MTSVFSWLSLSPLVSASFQIQIASAIFEVVKVQVSLLKPAPAFDKCESVASSD
jgi:hypothetical protein